MIIAIIAALIPNYFWKTQQISDVIYVASMITGEIFILGALYFDKFEYLGQY